MTRKMDVTFEKSSGNEDWLTPPQLLHSLGEFDLDPCAPINRPWDTAKKHYTKLDNGLAQKWEGRVWCNPPYGKKAGLFLNKLKHHHDGVALIFCRTETKVWFDNIWYSADAILFLKGRLKFYDINGKEGGSAGSPSCLVAYGDNNVKALEKIKDKGKLVYLKNDL